MPYVAPPLILPLFLNPKQKIVTRLLRDPKNKYFLLYGGSRSGKSVFIIYYMIYMSILYPGSRHLVARFSLANAKKTIFLQTMLPLLKPYEKNGLCHINRTQGIVEFYNGSSILLGGLQPDQIDSVLGSEYATIFVNEANENRWTNIELLFSRMNDTAVNAEGKAIMPRFFADLNPTSMTSWDYKFFTLKVHPETDEKHKDADRIVKLQMNPTDNLQNLHEDYMSTLEAMGEAKRKRFKDGEYGNYSGLIYNLPPELREMDTESSTFIMLSTRILGIDFGFIHPCVFSEVRTNGDTFCIYRENYETKMRPERVLKLALEWHEKNGYEYIVCDGARPELINMLTDAGLPAIPANKSPGSVYAGILTVRDLIERGKLFVNGDRCPMHLAEFDSYIWDEKAKEKGIEQPVKIDDDAMDASRYAIYTYLTNLLHNPSAESLLNMYKV